MHERMAHFPCLSDHFIADVVLRDLLPSTRIVSTVLGDQPSLFVIAPRSPVAPRPGTVGEMSHGGPWFSPQGVTSRRAALDRSHSRSCSERRSHKGWRTSG